MKKYKHKLTEKQVLEIERLYRETDRTYLDIAEQFDVTKNEVGSICRHEIWKRLWTWPPYTRPKKNNGFHWSERHYGLLIHCANEAARRFRRDRVLDRCDLISWGWLQCLRHRREDQLTGSGKFTILTMIEYGWFLKTGLHKDSRRNFEGTVSSLTDTDNFDPVDYRHDPAKIVEERELWENVRMLKKWKKMEYDKARMKRKREMIREAGQTFLPAEVEVVK